MTAFPHRWGVAVLTTALIGLAIVPALARPGQAHGAIPVKRHCTSKHGHKSRCRSALRALATGTVLPTDTATSLPATTTAPAPTDTASAPPTAIPTATTVPGPRFTNTHNLPVGVDAIVDNVTHVGAITGDYEAGDRDASLVDAPFGSYYLWILAQEENFGRDPFLSSPDNFELQSTDGTIYQAFPGIPPDVPDTDVSMYPSPLNRGDKNFGWLQFRVPARADIYTVLWNENGAAPFTAMGQVKIEAGVPFPGPLHVVSLLNRAQLRH